MAAVATQADSLRLSVSGVEVKHLGCVGAVPGVAPLLAAARNGPGSGDLKTEGDGTWILWRAPGSSSYGTPVALSGDGAYLLEDGDDRDAWLRVQAYTSYLLPAGAAGRVLLGDVYAGGTTDDDVAAGEATAGSVTTYTITLRNDSAMRLGRLVAWLDAATAGIEISDDGVAWVNPTSEATGLELPDLGPGATDTLHLRRTIAALADSDPEVLDVFHVAFDGL